MPKRREAETARIHAATHDGRGVADLPGKKVFVAGALPGEEVRLRRVKRRRNYDEAELLEVLSASPERVPARCAVFGTCGGCSLQHLAAAEQRRMKEDVLRESLARIGRCEPARWLAPLYDPVAGGEWNYRRRARLAVKDVAAKGRVLVGFRERHVPFVTEMRRCEVLAAPADGLIEALSELIGTLSIRARLPQIEVAVADNCTALVLRVLEEPTAGDRAALCAFAARHGVQLALQPGGPDRLEDLYPVPAETLRYALPEFDLHIAFDATEFVQINAAVNRLLVARAVELLDPEPGDRVLDLFCGIGNFSLPLARRCGYVLGLEIEARQVARARQNAAQNGIDHCDFETADLAALGGSESWLGQSWDGLLLDPARSGASAVLREAGSMGPRRIVYVSCHPGTLARDAAELLGGGAYRLEAAGIVDMFPHTAHVEAIAVFTKK